MAAVAVAGLFVAPALAAAPGLADAALEVAGFLSVVDAGFGGSAFFWSVGLASLDGYDGTG